MIVDYIFFCGVPGHYDNRVRNNGIILSLYVIPDITINSTSRLPPPLCLFFCRLPSSSTRPSSRRLLSLQNSPPNLAACCHCHRPLSLHSLLPHRLTRCIIRRPPSTRQHRHRHHCCNPLLIPTALVALSASNRPLLAHFLPTAAIVTATPFLL